LLEKALEEELDEITRMVEKLHGQVNLCNKCATTMEGGIKGEDDELGEKTLSVISVREMCLLRRRMKKRNLPISLLKCKTKING
jgi:hypothetical protein